MQNTPQAYGELNGESALREKLSFYIDNVTLK